MAKIIASKKLLKEDFDPDNQELIGKIGYVMNPLMEQIVDAFSNNLTFDENLNVEIRNIDITVDNFGVPKSTTFFKPKIKGKVRGILVLNIVNITTNTASFEKTISAISIASSSIITTTTDHGLNMGDIVVIAGSNSTPSVDGKHQVLPLSSNTFQIPFMVSGAGNAGKLNINNFQFLSSAPFIQFEQTQTAIKIQHVTGLIPNYTYRITVMAI